MGLMALATLTACNSESHDDPQVTAYNVTTQAIATTCHAAGSPEIEWATWTGTPATATILVSYTSGLPGDVNVTRDALLGPLAADGTRPVLDCATVELPVSQRPLGFEGM